MFNLYFLRFPQWMAFLINILFLLYYYYIISILLRWNSWICYMYSFFKILYISAPFFYNTFIFSGSILFYTILSYSINIFNIINFFDLFYDHFTILNHCIFLFANQFFILYSPRGHICYKAILNLYRLMCYYFIENSIVFYIT